MDYNQNDFYRMTNGSSQKMPFYMTYPMQNVFLEEAEYERDMQRLKSMYPKELGAVQRLVEEECDKLEYEGSMMFDEVPDRFMVKQISERIYRQAVQPEDYEAQQYESVEAEELRMADSRHHGGPPPFRPPHHHRPPNHRPNQGLPNLIDVLLFHEMFNRRCRHKRCRRWW